MAVLGTDGKDQTVRQRKQGRSSSSSACNGRNGCDVGNLTVEPFQSKGRYKGRRRKIGRKGFSTGRRSLYIGLALVIAGSILSLVVIAVVTGHYSSPSEIGGPGRDCIESHINGISGNVYSWCYKNSEEKQHQQHNHHHDHTSSHDKRKLNNDRTASGVERVIRDESGNTIAGEPQKILAAINAHEHLNFGTIVNDDQENLCYADMSRLGNFNLDNHEAYYQPAIGPCHYDYSLTNSPKNGYEEEIDYFFFRDSEDSKFTDKIRCLNECVDRVLVGADHAPSLFSEGRNLREPEDEYPVERSMDELRSKHKVPADDFMLIEAVRAGMTFIVEKLIVKHGLDPFYRPVQNDPGNSRSLNAIQEAIRGGYAEIVKILTNGDNSVTIDQYGRSVEDYIKLKGSPITPSDAKNILGIEVEYTLNQLHRTNNKHGINNIGNKSGWSEKTATPFDEDYCDFDVVEGDISPEIFYRDYFITGRPLAMRGVSPEMELEFFSKNRWKETEKFNPEELFDVGPTAYPPLTDQESCSEQMSIEDIEEAAVCEDFPEKPMVHAFHPQQADFNELFPGYDGDVLDPRGGFRTMKNWFPSIERINDAVWQVFFGGDGSGATYHWHEAAFNILYVGIKQWKIGPPLYRGTTGMTAKRVSETLDEKMHFTCVQRPGDMFYIPNYWGHSTFNHGFTIGAAAIVSDYYQMAGSTLRGDPEEISDDVHVDDTVEQHKPDDDDEKIPFLFVHINKTGGTSIIRMFEERCEEEYYGGQWWDDNDQYHRAFHATAHAYIEHYGRKAWDDAYTFAVVRHPLARQVSNFFFLASNGCVDNAVKCEERLIPKIDLESMSDEEKLDVFHKWIIEVYNKFPPSSTDHYRFGAAGHGNEVYDTFSSTQTSWLVDPSGDIVVQEIFHLEDLSKDISKLADNIPCLKNGSLDMEKHNKTPKYPNYMLFAKRERTRTIINEVFAEDFKNLGYEPLI